MKKWLCFVLSLLLCLSFSAPISADETMSETVMNLILIAKEKLAISDDVVEFSDYSHTRFEGKQPDIYHLFWRGKEENAYNTVSATLTETGRIISYNKQEDKTSVAEGFPKHTGQEAVEVAKKFIETVEEGLTADLDAGEAEWDYYGRYTVYFGRVHRGIPVAGNGVQCTVNSETLTVDSYELSWDEVAFQEGTSISPEEAKKIFSEQMGYQLFYQVVSESYENRAGLVYRPRYDEPVVIDALTGKTMTYEAIQSAYRESLKNSAMMDQAVGSASLSEKELALIREVSGMLTEQEADHVCRRIPEFGLTKDYRKNSFGIHRQASGEYVINITYSLEQDEKSGYKSFSLDAATGLVLRFSGNNYVMRTEEAQSSKDIPAEKLARKGQEFLTQYYGDYLPQLQKKAYFGERPDRLEYLRIYDGVPIYNNGVTLSYDKQTGELIGFYLRWTEVDFPHKVQVAAPAEANAVAMEQGCFDLRYLIAKGEQESENIGILAYSMERTPIFDAGNLNEVDGGLRPVMRDEVPSYADLTGYYAEEKIRELLSYKIFLEPDENGSLKPEEAIAQLDFLLLLDRAIWHRNYEQDTEWMYRSLLRDGVLTKEEIQPEKAITRMEGIRYLLCAMGYGEFVKIPGIFNCPFADVPEKDAGYGAVAYGVKLAQGDGVYFYPENSLRRGDALLLIYNYLAR